MFQNRLNLLLPLPQLRKRDTQRGYCLTIAGRLDEYVEVDRLTKYLDKLKPK